MNHSKENQTPLIVSRDPVDPVDLIFGRQNIMLDYQNMNKL